VTTRRTVLGLALLGAVLAAPSGATNAAKTTKTNAPMNRETRHQVVTERVHRIVLDVKAGGVVVTAAGKGPVRVAQTSRWSRSKPTVRAFVLRGTLFLEGRCRHSRLCGTYFDLRVPAGVAIDVRSGAAKVGVHGIPGNVSINTGVGGITVSVERPPRRISAETDVGDVAISVPRGPFRVDTQADLGRERIRGITVTGRAARMIRAKTDIGDITIAGR
jgi:hypothetical protein